MKEYDKIPYPYSQYLINIDRENLIERAWIIITDDSFDKLYKIAKLNVNPINFGICAL